MTANQLIKHFGSAAKAAKALGYNRQSIYDWKKTGIPLRTQAWIQVETGGVFKADKK